MRINSHYLRRLANGEGIAVLGVRVCVCVCVCVCPPSHARRSVGGEGNALCYVSLQSRKWQLIDMS